MFHRIACIIFSGILLISVSSVKAESEKQEVAISGALNWLTLVDEAKYEDSWNDAAEYFKTVVKKEQWVQSLQAVRKPLGNIISRETKNATYKASLPGAPKGQYVIIPFQTSFKNKNSAIETVTPMLDKDGNWRVSGYYIK